MISFRKILLLTLILLGSFVGGSILIWQGLNLDRSPSASVQPQVLGNQLNTVTATPSGEISPGPDSNNNFLVTKVFDGDTFQIKIKGEPVSVRMIRIDTPETIDPRRAVGCFGKKASDETKRLIEGKEVTLTKDVSETDKYQRL